MFVEFTIAGGALVASYPAIPITVHYCAKAELLFKQVRENSAVIVAKHEEVERVLFVSRERHLKKEGSGYDVFDVVAGPEPSSLKKALRKFFLFGGIRFLGIPVIDQPLPYLHFATTFREDGGSNGQPRYRIETRTELVHQIPMQDEIEPFIAHITFADGTRAYVVILARINKVNPVRMVFGASHWWEATRQEITSTVSTSLSPLDLKSLLRDKKSIEAKMLDSLNQKDSGIKDYGVRVSKLSLLVAEPASEKDAEAVRILYEGTQRAEVITRISQSIKENGVAGLQAGTLEALQRSDGNVVLVGKEVGGIALPVAT